MRCQAEQRFVRKPVGVTGSYEVSPLVANKMRAPQMGTRSSFRPFNARGEQIRCWTRMNLTILRMHLNVNSIIAVLEWFESYVRGLTYCKNCSPLGYTVQRDTFEC